MAVLSDLGLYLWRLLPANPILVRVVSAAGKRVRHLWARVAYLVALIAVFLFGGGLLLGSEARPLSELAKQASQTFTAVSIVQLVLMSFVAPVFCAGAITQEKDANTFHILLTTPLSNGQIVLGSLFSRLYFVWALLISGLPIFCITMLYGGVTTREIFESFGLAACTGLLTGSIAIMISFLHVGTRRTIFAFFGGIAIYLLGVYSIGLAPAGQLAAAPAAPGAAGTIIPGRMSWLAPLHPFLALLVVTGRTPAPDWADVAGFAWPFDWLLAYPQYGYMAVSTLASVVMIAISLFYVRRGAQDRDAGGWLSALVRRFAPGEGERTRRSRRVWRNPIAWREAATRGSAGGQSALRWLFVVAGGAAGLTLAVAHHSGWWGLGPSSVATTRSWLTALIWIELLVVLLVITSTAATTLTREKESATMEMLLTTPLTSRYIIAGMLQGLVRLVIPLIAVPTFTLCAIAIGDLVRWSAGPVIALEAVFAAPAVMIAFAALAGMVGLHFSLQFKRTVQSVMVSIAVVLGAAGLLWACGFAVAGSGGPISAIVLPFTPFPAVWALIDPWSLVQRQSAYRWGGGAPTAADVAGFRVAACVFTLVAIAVYAGITYALYAAMVRDFDMTVRKQSV